MKEEHVMFLRNEARSKVEVLFEKDGWKEIPNDDLFPFKDGETEVSQDAYVIRVWGIKGDGQARVHEIRLRASEMKLLQRPLR